MEAPPPDMSYRCAHCGNKTRFDVYESVHRRRFHHYSLGGGMTVEEDEILDSHVDRIVCRWCDRADAIEVVPGAGADR